jgi:hypothetical protein
MLWLQLSLADFQGVATAVMKFSTHIQMSCQEEALAYNINNLQKHLIILIALD